MVDRNIRIRRRPVGLSAKLEEHERHKEWQIGHEEGYTKGFVAGTAEGKRDGVNQGKDLARRELLKGHRETLAALHEQQRTELVDASERGYNDGHAYGEQKGYARGYAEGLAEGRTLVRHEREELLRKGREQGYNQAMKRLSQADMFPDKLDDIEEVDDDAKND